MSGSQDESSYRNILRSTSIVGGATAGAILIGLVRVKIFTLLIGPAGLGLFGVLNGIMMTGAVLAGLGIATSGVTELAAASKDVTAASRVRAAIWSLTWLLALAGGAVLFVLREPVAMLAAGSPDHQAAVGWLGVGVALSVIAASQSAVLQGFRRIADLGRVKLYGALIGAIVGIAAVATLPYYGVVAALIATPLGLIVVAMLYNRRLVAWRWREVPTRSLAPEWRTLTTIGFAVMIWTLIGTATQIAVRAMIVRDGGLEAAGLYQAAWMVSANYQVLILAAMLNDYLPRLSAIAEDQGAVRRLVERQLRVALLLAAPMLAGMIAAAPIVLTLLYSSEFTGATRLLQWQLAGDALKIAGWALGIVLMARRDMGFFIVGELVFSLVYLTATEFLLPAIGLEAAGVAYFTGYFVYLIAIMFICWRRQRIAMSARDLRLTIGVVLVLVALVIVAYFSQVAAFVIGSAAALALAVHALQKLAAENVLPARLDALVRRLRLI